MMHCTPEGSLMLQVILMVIGSFYPQHTIHVATRSEVYSSMQHVAKNVLTVKLVLTGHPVYIIISYNS